jgi:thymidylate synthase (FAD)
MDVPARRTRNGTPYLQEPGVVLLARPATSVAGLAGFLGDLNPEFADYLNDPTPLPPGTLLCKVAGQICYQSFGRRRTPNAQAAGYFANILEQGHGSVLEHANYTVLLYGVSRSLTHELVRHRHLCFSQVSQRYVDAVRFVERPEFQADPELHAAFEARIDAAARQYAELTEAMRARRAAAGGTFASLRRADQRKAVQQAARALLPNETEAPIVVTGNVRAWRHVIALRTSPHAEPEIRRALHRVWRVLVAEEPLLFGDYAEQPLPDGTTALRTPYPKV